jgi:lysine-specific permease
LALILCIIVTAGQNYSAFTGAEIDWYGASVAYIGIPLFFAIFFWHKLKHHTKMIPLEEVDLSRKAD